MRLKDGDKVGIVACSDPLKTESKPKVDEIMEKLEDAGLVAISSEYIYDKGNGFAGTGLQRAETLMSMYEDDEIKAILDVSGGDMANQLLPYLDFEIIKGHKKPFIGYSDLTVLCNVLSVMGENEAILYSPKNIISNDEQTKRLISFLKEDDERLLAINYEMVRGEEMKGEVIGGNIRCFLKLAGSKFMPDFKDKILLLEANSGGIPQMTTFLSQYKYLGILDEVNGVLLGTFCGMEAKGLSILPLLDEYLPKDTPVAITREIGHYTDSKGIYINKYQTFKKGS